MRKSYVLICVAFVVTVLLAGCNEDESSGTSCTVDSDCATGQSCVSGNCEDMQFCTSDLSCPYGHYCSDGRCVASPSCTTWEDCPSAFDCIDGLCFPQSETPETNSCEIDADCPPNHFCDMSMGQCQPRGSTDGDVELSCNNTRDCPDGYRCESGKCVAWNDPDGDTPDDGDVPDDGDTPDDGDDPDDGDIPEGLLCRPCNNDMECGGEENYCMEDMSGEKYCARSCGVEDPCPGGYRCSDIFSGTGEVVSSQCLPASGYCDGSSTPDGDVPPDGDGQGLCEPCESDDDCGGVYDKCIPDSSHQFYCGTDCSHDQPCLVADTYCKRISESVRQCFPISNVCGNYIPPDGDTPPDGDIPPDGDLPGCDSDAECAPGEVCDSFTRSCIYVLCRPCTSVLDCESIFTTECINGGCATDCLMSSCPPGFVCQGDFFGRYCEPESGSCFGPTDGDTPDGDASDGDTPDGDTDGDADPCSGACYDPNEMTCMGDELCTCTDGQYVLNDCLDLCLNNGFTGYDSCSYDSEDGHDLCWCTDDDPDGDSDGDIPDGDSSGEPEGTCDDPFVIDSLPYSNSSSTAPAWNNLGVSYCDLGWDFANASGPDHVYRLETSAGQIFNASVEGADFDVVLSVRFPCNDFPDQCLGTNASGAYFTDESIGIEMNVDETVYIVVDGNGQSEYGSYTINVW